MSYRGEAEMEETTPNTRTQGQYPPAASSSSSYGRNRQQQQQQRQASGASASSSSPQPLSYPRNSGSDEDGNTANSYTATSEAHLINSRETYASTSYIPPGVSNQEQQPQYASYNHERSYSQQRRRASPRQAQPTPSPRSPESYNRPDYFNNHNNNNSSSSNDNQLPIARDKMEYGSPMSDINDTPGFSFTEDKLSSAQAHSYGAGLDKNGIMDKEISRSHTGGIMAPRTGHAGNDNAGVSSIIKGYGTPHQIAYLCVVLLQTISTAALVSVVWAKIRDGTPVGYNGFSSFFSGNNDETAIKRRTVTVYLAIFLFGSVFEIITAIDALRLNNTIQLIGVCMFTVAMMVYSALLDGQIENAVTTQDGYSPDLYPSVRPYIIAMPIIQGVAVLALAWFTYKLFQDFGWEVLHLIGADRKLKRVYTKYQIFVCLVKFDFFFFVGFSLQYMILVLKVQEAEFIITIVAFPLTIIALILAIVAVRRENKSLSYVIFIAELCALAYFVFKFFRLFQTSQAFRYQNSRKTLAVFSALAMIMLLCTFVCSVFCFLNFGKGLKEAIPGYFGEHRASRRQKISRKNSNAAGTMLAPPPSRMEID